MRSAISLPVAPIDLHELAMAIATVTRLLDTLLALTPRQPDAVIDAECTKTGACGF